MLLAAGASTHPFAVKEAIDQVADDATRCCIQIVAAPAPFWRAGPAEQAATSSGFSSASRVRIVSPLLPIGVAPERGLQVRTILAARSISDAFPEIHQIGGVRSDALKWHPNGLALDVMVPNPGTTEGIALGDKIVDFALKNAARFGLQDAIWRGAYYTPDGRQRTGYGHYDHVHITTTGGGYPTGDEVYFR